MSGSGNRFQPNETVSRAMVATVLYYFSRETGTYSSSFTDVSSSAWYYNPVSWAAQKGIMYGTSNTVFNPNGMITREQLMATLYRYAGYRGKARDTTDRVSRCGDYSSISSYAIPAMNWAVNTGILHLGLPTACICPRSLVSRKWLAFYMSKLSSKVLGMEKADRYAFSNAERYMKTVGNGYYVSGVDQTSVYKGYKQDKIEMRGDRAEMSDFPLYLNTVAGGLDRRDQTIGGFSFVVKIYAVPVVEIIG